MPGPVKAFIPLNGLSLFIVPVPITIMPIKFQALVVNYRIPYSFFKFGLIKQNNTVQPIGIKMSFTTTIKLPLAPLIRQMLITFPPIYKTRSGRQRPLKGQLWPRTR